MPLNLSPRRGSSATAAIYETASGVVPKLRVELKQRDPSKGEVEFNARVERVMIESAVACPDPEEGNTDLRMRMTLTSGGETSVVTVTRDSSPRVLPTSERVGATAAMARERKVTKLALHLQDSGIVNNCAADNGEDRSDVPQVRVRHREVVPVEHHDIAQLPELERAELVLLAQEPAVVPRVEAQDLLV